MDRLFSTHNIRRQISLDGIWTLSAGTFGPASVVVPGVWESIPALHNYQGPGTYRKEIACGGNVRLWFGGVGFRARVWLDDTLLTTHYGAYSGFEALALDVEPGVHTLTVEADNHFAEDSALHVPNDYYSYGGITRPVVQESLKGAYITRLHVTPLKTESGWQARISAAVRNLEPHTQQYELELQTAGADTSVQFTLTAGEEGTVEVLLDCPQARVWCPETPVLYEVTATLYHDGTAMDDLVDRFGFRDIQVLGKAICLNGKPLKLKGFNRHEDFGSFGSAVPLSAMMQDLHLMRDLGANCVRTCHYPNDPRFLDLCDEMGMLVWEESHARGLSEQQMRNPNFMPQSILNAQEMVSQHYNHPSIFIWGCLNECADDCDYGADCFRRLFQLMKELDDTRPVTAALLERPGSRVFGDSDVVSVNIYPKWYHNQSVRDRLDEKIREIQQGGGGDKPLIVSEIGAGGIYGYHDPFGEAKWSEERQCTILREQIETVLNCPECVGLFLWQFADVRVDENWAIHRPKTVNNKGIVDEYRRPKMAYSMVKALFTHNGP